MLAATAVSDLPIAEVLENRRWARMLTEIARQVLAQAPVPPVPLDGFDPADLDGSLERLAEFNRRSAKTHSGIYRDLAILHRPTEVPAILGGLAGEQAPLVRRGGGVPAAGRAGHPGLPPGQPPPPPPLRPAAARRGSARVPGAQPGFRPPPGGSSGSSAPTGWPPAQGSSRGRRAATARARSAPRFPAPPSCSLCARAAPIARARPISRARPACR